jgi:hypothetical protein
LVKVGDDKVATPGTATSVLPNLSHSAVPDSRGVGEPR